MIVRKLLPQLCFKVLIVGEALGRVVGGRREVRPLADFSGFYAVIFVLLQDVGIFVSEKELAVTNFHRLSALIASSELENLGNEQRGQKVDLWLIFINF